MAPLLKNIPHVIVKKLDTPKTHLQIIFLNSDNYRNYASNEIQEVESEQNIKNYKRRDATSPIPRKTFTVLSGLLLFIQICLLDSRSSQKCNDCNERNAENQLAKIVSEKKECWWNTLSRLITCAQLHNASTLFINQSRATTIEYRLTYKKLSKISVWQ